MLAKDLKRDSRTGLLINTNDTEYQTILAERQSRKQDRLRSLEVQDLRSQISNLTDLVNRLLKERT